MLEHANVVAAHARGTAATTIAELHRSRSRTTRSGSGRRSSRISGSSSRSRGSSVRRRLARARVGDVVRRRAAQHRAELRPPLGARRPDDDGGRSGSARTARGRALTYAELSHEVTRLAEALVALGVEPGDRVAHLPADVAARSRSPRTRARTSARSRCRSSRASPRRRSPRGSQDAEAKVADHARTGRCAAAGAVPMKAIADEAAARRAVARGDGRLAAARRRRADAGGPRLCVGRGRRGVARRAAAARGRRRAPVPARLHVGHDRPAEGRRPRPRRLPRLDRARGRLPGRRAARRPLSTSPPTWAGSWARGRWSAAARVGATIVFAEGAPDWPRRPALAARRAGARDDARRLADARSAR